MRNNSDEILKVLKGIHSIIDGSIRETYQTEDEAPLAKIQSTFQILGSSFAHHSESYIDSSLLLRRILEWIRLTVWSQVTILSGAYESALRELRYLLEDVLVTLIADQRNPTGTVEERLNTVKELEIEKPRKRGFHLIKLCRTENIIQNDDVMDILVKQYDKLCAFTHPSREVVEGSIDITRYGRFSYNSEMYNHVTDLYMTTVDCLLVLIFWHMDAAAQRAFAIFFYTRMSRTQDFIETNRVCRPIERKWWKGVTESLKRKVEEQKKRNNRSVD